MIEKGLRLRAERWWFTQHYGFGLWNQIRKGWVDFYLKIFLSLQIIGKGFLFFFFWHDVCSREEAVNTRS